jgi:uncharacterized integral membrane protein
MAVVVFVLGAIVGMAVLIFGFQNQEPVTLRYLYGWETQPIPLFIVIMAAAGSGFLIASLFGFAAYLRARATVRQQRRHIADLQAELYRLRTLPLEVPSGVGSSAPAPTPYTTSFPDPAGP